MKFTSASLVEQVIWEMRMSDLPRGTNRALIDRLANGLPPWTKEEQEAARIKTNVNWLEFPKLAADARRSYYNAFLKPGVFFNVSLDYGGKPSDRRIWGRSITKAINRCMKDSPAYFEFLRSQFALTVLHGIGPAVWMDREKWCPTCIGIEDLLIPSNTLLSMSNLSHFAVYRQFTPMELRMMTDGHKVDPAWNMDLVKAALAWADTQINAQLAYSDLYAPQKIEERWKQDLGFYGTDTVPTINAWDFYFWSDDDKQHGWRRRMVLDTPASFEIQGKQKSMPDKNMIDREHGEWLYCPNDKRVFAPDISQIVHFQFGDASAVAPFRYHSVRSLGWLLYAVCHVQNRLRCKINDALFESLLQYFRVSNPDDRERMLKIDLHDYGVVPEGVDFIKPQDRWQINTPLVELGLTQNRSMMDESAAQYREGRDMGQAGGIEKTATQIMAEVNAANALVGSMLLQSYQYQKFQYKEIARRFCVKNSSDPDVRKFRLMVLKSDVPEGCLDSSLWEIEPERVMGNGNKTLELAIADKLMAARPLHDPEAQRIILRLHDEIVTDVPDLASQLVPEQRNMGTDSIHDAQAIVGRLMHGLPVTPTDGQNDIDMIESFLTDLTTLIKKTEMKGPLATADDVFGLMTVADTAGIYIQRLAQDKNQKAKANVYIKALKDMATQIKKIGAIVQQANQQQPEILGGNGGADPTAAAKIQATNLQAQNKVRQAAISHQQKTQQRQVQFQQKLKQDQERHQADLAKKLQEVQVDTAAKDLTTAAEIKHKRLKAVDEADENTSQATVTD